jgi:hypothetical protein
LNAGFYSSTSFCVLRLALKHQTTKGSIANRSIYQYLDFMCYTLRRRHYPDQHRQGSWCIQSVLSSPSFRVIRPGLVEHNDSLIPFDYVCLLRIRLQAPIVGGAQSRFPAPLIPTPDTFFPSSTSIQPLRLRPKYQTLL